MWTNKLQASLAAVAADDAGAAARRSTYYELDVLSASPIRQYGGCAAWTGLLSSDVKPALFTHKASGLTLSSEVTSGQHKATCADPAVVRSILSAAVSQPTFVGASAVAKSFACGTATWTVRHCPVQNGALLTYAPALCVDCADPCSSALQCSGSSVLSLSPCVQQQCTGSSSVTALRILSASFVDLEKPPTVLSASIAATKTSLTVTAQLSSAGTVYCALYRAAASPSAPASVDAVLLQNLRGATDAANTTTLTIQGLDAATAYRVYLLTASPVGVMSTLADVISSVRVRTTDCCKSVTGTLATTSAIESQNSAGILSVVLDSKPSATLTVQVQLYTVDASNGVASLYSQSLFPASFTVTSASTSTVLSASLPALPAGLYEYRLSLSGSSAAEYQVVYGSSGQRIDVVSAITEPPTPTLSQALFAQDGSYITVVFSAATNRGNTATSFPCGALFNFTCAATSKCQWTDSSTVRAAVQGAVNSDACVRPGSSLGLVAGAKVKAKCQAAGDTGTGNACPRYSDWATTPLTSVKIGAPSSPVSPTVAISAPSVLGSCDSLALDVSGSSGSGGRAWSRSALTVSSTAGVNVTALSAALRGVTVLTPPPVLPAALFSKGAQYNFQVTLCNFLGQCGTGSKQVLVLNDTVPSVSLPGPSLRTVSRKDGLSLASAAILSTCDGKRTSAGLVYKWSIATNNVQLLTATSTSKDASRYLLAPYALTAGVFYQVTLAVNAAGSAQSSSASVQVYVQPGRVLAVVKGGSAHSVRASNKLTLDASGSADDDQNGVAGTAAGLQFAWSCYQTAPQYSQDCSAVFNATALAGSQTTSFLELSPVPTAAGAECVVSLAVSDAAGTRISSTSVTVAVLAALAPVVSVAAPSLPASGVINAGQQLQLTGSLSVPASLGGNGTWVVDDASVDLTKIALFPTSAVFAPVGTSQTAVASKALFMAFAPNTLPAGRTLTFSLVGTIPYQGRRAVASVTVKVNAPPSPGSFYVTPDEGVELQQSFQFVAQNWVDPDLPISYQFSYVSAAGVTVVVRSRLELSFGASLLPAGNSDAGSVVPCVAQIFDALNANSSSEYAVKVTKSAALNATQVEDFVRRSLVDAATDADSIKQATALSSYLLNAVNCSLATDCVALHRKSCLSTAHTCGVCESLDYVGEEGDSNTACIYKVDVMLNRRRLSDTVAATDELKPCRAECSGHGTCVHVTDAGQLVAPPMSPCVVGSSGCSAVCDCEDAYFGSEICEFPAEVFAQRQSSRAQVVAGLGTLVKLENPDEQVIAGWVAGVTMAAQSAAELSESSGLEVLSLVDSITQSAGGIASVSTETVAALVAAVNAVATSFSQRSLRRRLRALRRGLAEDVTTAVTPSVTRDVLNNFGSLVAKSMLPGQSAANFTQGELRMSVHVLAASDGATETAGNTPVTVPQTALERYQGAPATSVTVPTSNTAQPASVVVTSLKAAQFSQLGEDLQSNPVSVHTSAPLCASLPCPVQVTLQNYRAVGFAGLNGATGTEEYHSVTCAAGEHSVHEVTCSSGDTVSLECTGTAGEVTRQCPVTRYSSACSSLSSSADSILSGTASGCTMLSYTDTEVVCSCETLVQLGVGDESRRTLQQAGYNFTAAVGYSVSYVSMLQATTDTFLSTIKTADDLNASTVAKGWRALATLGAVAGAILVGLLWSHHKDGQAKRIRPVNDDKAPSVMASKVGKLVKSVSTTRVRFNTRVKKALVNAELAIVEDSLPRVLSSRTFTDRFLEEVKQHHRWFGIVFYYSDSFPRVLRVISLATNAIVMLFIQSITYNLTNPDDGSCEALHTQSSCLAPRSAFATGESKCAWTASGTTAADMSGSCAYIEPDGSVRIILFVAIFCAIVTTPIALAADWLVGNVLAAPTAEAEAEAVVDPAAVAALPADPTAAQFTSVVPVERSGAVRRRSSGAASLINFLGVFNPEKARADKELLARSRAELVMLSMKLRAYRERLRPDEVEEFNLLWGLDAEGKFLTKSAEATTYLAQLKGKLFKKENVDVRQAVLMDLKNINEAVQRESLAWKEAHTPRHEIGKKLLFLFQCDLLPGISGKILELKGSRDNSTVKHVSLRAKVLGYTVLCLMNVGMLFYILLFALTQTGPRQNAWFQSFALWLVVEILLVSTGIVFVTHILIPSLVMKDLTQIKRRLMDNIREFNEKVQVEKAHKSAAVGAGEALVAKAEGSDDRVSFNAANFLFVSTRLAREFPELRESKIIAQFSTPWPKQSYLHVNNTSKKYSKKFTAVTRSASVLLIFFVGNFLSVPPSIQDMVVQMTSTTAIGYIVLVHVQLYEIFPALVVLPALLLAALAHFVVQSSRADAKIKLARLFPASKKKVQVADESTRLPERARVESTDGVGMEVTEGAEAYDSDHFSSGSEDSDTYDVQHLPTRAMVAVARPVHDATLVPGGAHRSRRQSIQAGLELLHVMADGSAHCDEKESDRRSAPSTIPECAQSSCTSASSSSRSHSHSSGHNASTSNSSRVSASSRSARSNSECSASEADEAECAASVVSNDTEGSEDSTDTDGDAEDSTSASDAEVASAIEPDADDLQVLHMPVGTPATTPRTLERKRLHSPPTGTATRSNHSGSESSEASSARSSSVGATAANGIQQDTRSFSQHSSDSCSSDDGTWSNHGAAAGAVVTGTVQVAVSTAGSGSVSHSCDEESSSARKGDGRQAADAADYCSDHSQSSSEGDSTGSELSSVVADEGAAYSAAPAAQPTAAVTFSSKNLLVDEDDYSLNGSGDDDNVSEFDLSELSAEDIELSAAPAAGSAVEGSATTQAPQQQVMKAELVSGSVNNAVAVTKSTAVVKRGTVNGGTTRVSGTANAVGVARRATARSAGPVTTTAAGNTTGKTTATKPTAARFTAAKKL
jgi:hypothetical protein